MWIKRHLRKKHEPVVVIPDNYGSHFTAWWNNIQPQWRLQPDGSYSTACPADENWSALRKGGSSGLYLVVVSLSWWIAAVTQSGGDSAVWILVDDFIWVLQQIYNKYWIYPKGKRVQKEAQSEQPKR